MGLMAPQLRHGSQAAVLTAQLHRRTALERGDHRQQTPITAEGGVVLAAVDPAAASTFNAATATQQADGQKEEQQRRSDWCQSSKRELLSRGREAGPLLRELLGAGRLLVGRLPVGLCLELKAASSAAGRLG